MLFDIIAGFSCCMCFEEDEGSHGRPYILPYTKVTNSEISVSPLLSPSPRSIKFKSNNIPVALFPCPSSERADKYPHNGPLLEILLESSLFYGSGLELQMVIIDSCLLMEVSGEIGIDMYTLICIT